MYRDDRSRFVGKIVYAARSDVPLHCMALLDAHMDVALNATLVASLRHERRSEGGQSLDCPELFEWSKRLAIDPLIELVRSCLDAHAACEVVREIGGESGVMFEALKLACFKNSKPCPPYLVEGTLDGKVRFDTLHREDAERFEYRLIDTSSDLPASRIDIFNHNQLIRHADVPAEQFFRILGSLAPHAVVAIRYHPKASVDRITVQGNDVYLPRLDELKANLANREWQAKIVPTFDDGVFLPDETAPCGLLLAYRLNSPHQIAGFKPFEEVIPAVSKT